MPHSCSAWKCTNRCTPFTRSQGITFHKFPKDEELRKQWEAAVGRKGFSASRSSSLCSEHFGPEHFDRTGQTVRIRAGVVPSVFRYPGPDRPKPVVTRTSRTSKKAREPLTLDRPKLVQEAKPLPLPNVEHCYALPSSHDDLRARLTEALARVESLERERRNAMDRERRAKYTVCSLLHDLMENKLMNEELKEQLEIYSELPLPLLSKQSQKESTG
ncbi:THAP domain-containing protein 6 [Larimichthys crocea]|uniref:THAP domain-containing protein 6 n=1 Tax=Larimichthys crocea TaxID=215358 RepID=A0A6G0I2A1_LARCR|nr:THAP domain-containing protein 6 [Larimichthys crocea]KAE8285325.1 THAP domain-containing protein 6 [Larimichthys crocea]KAE8285336.1 THAP domain-containing protein 6 [Larimichthys crocea]